MTHRSIVAYEGGPGLFEFKYYYITEDLSQRDFLRIQYRIDFSKLTP